MMTLRDQLAELNAALTEHNAQRLRSLLPPSDEEPVEPRATHWKRLGMRERLRVIAAALGGKR
jgi:hypothetical protein